jgi:hypothetical protein
LGYVKKWKPLEAGSAPKGFTDSVMIPNTIRELKDAYLLYPEILSRFFFLIFLQQIEKTVKK